MAERAKQPPRIDQRGLSLIGKRRFLNFPFPYFPVLQFPVLDLANRKMEDRKMSSHSRFKFSPLVSALSVAIRTDYVAFGDFR